MDLATILTDSAHQVERAKPADERLQTEDWTAPGEAWFASFMETVEMGYSEHQQRQLDIKSGEALDRRATASTSYADSDAYKIGWQQQEIKNLRAALAGLIGLTELVSARDDVPTEVKDALRTNHRIVEARRLMTQLQQ